MLGKATSYWDFVFANMMLGLGATTYHPVGLGMVSNSFSNQSRGKAMAINHSAGVIGTAISPVISIALTLSFSKNWRTTSYIYAGFSASILCIMLVWLFSHHLIAKYRVTEHKLKEETNLAIEKQEQVNIFDKANRFLLITIVLVLLIGMLRSSIYRSLSSFTATLLNDFYNLSELEAGFYTTIILTIGSMSDITGAVISDRLGTVRGRANVVILSAVGTAVAILLLILAPLYSAFVLILLLFSFFAVSFYLVGGTLLALQSNLIPGSARSFFYSITFSIGLIITSVTPSIFGTLLDIFKTPVAPFSFLLVLTLISLGTMYIFKLRLLHLEETDQLSD